MVLALDAENEPLRAVVRTLKDMIFGARSDRLAAVADEQLALELNDLETRVTPPPAANDDKPADKPFGMSAKTCKKATRNIGALPKHLPRCEQVVEPETTVCPCCRFHSCHGWILQTLHDDRLLELLDNTIASPSMIFTLSTDRPPQQQWITSTVTDDNRYYHQNAA
jgi:Transposase C of IS166 homeodomain